MLGNIFEGGEYIFERVGSILRNIFEGGKFIFEGGKYIFEGGKYIFEGGKYIFEGVGSMLRMGNVFLQIPLHLLSRLLHTETHIFIFGTKNLAEKSGYYFRISVFHYFKNLHIL